MRNIFFLEQGVRKAHRIDPKQRKTFSTGIWIFVKKTIEVIYVFFFLPVADPIKHFFL